VVYPSRTNPENNLESPDVDISRYIPNSYQVCTNIFHITGISLWHRCIP
jgi:hypothetical protein